MSKASTTQIFMVIDRSGSMSSNQAEVEGGVNHFIQEQAKQPGKCWVHVYDFDTEYRKVFAAKAKKAPHYTLEPRGLTALNDAVGATITDAKKLVKKGELVILVIATDGIENASKEYSRSDVKAAIEKVEKKGWQVTFIGADINAFHEGASLGVKAGKTMQFDKAAAGKAYGSVSNAVTRSRMSHSVGADATLDYTADERESAVTP